MSANNTLASLNFEIGDEPLGMPRDPNRPKPGWARAVMCLQPMCGAMNCFESNPDTSTKLVRKERSCTRCAQLVKAWVHE